MSTSTASRQADVRRHVPATRHGLGWRVAALGVLAAPVVLGLLLVAMPMLPAGLGLMPAS